MSNLSDRGTLRGTLQRNSGNYNDLINKPAINGHTLIGNQSGHALGLANEDDIIYVEANPLGPATADLRKILVDNTIYSIPDVVVYGTVSGAIASFDDGGDNKHLKSLKVAINPVQDLHGYDYPWAAGAGKNKLNKDELSNVNTSFQSKQITLSPNTEYTISTTLPKNNNNSANLFMYLVGGSPVTNVNGVWEGQSRTITTDGTGIVVIGYRSVDYTDTSSTWYLSHDMQIEQGSQATTLEPYSNICPISGWDEAEIHRADGATPHIIDDTYNIIWSEAGTVYEGTLDVTNGKLKARPYYASYNGETLVGPWISSMDVYAPSTPPTTGAQVVDLGGVETEIDISPTQITTLLGNNNIWSDTGEILDCVYQRDINIALNKALNQ